MKKRFVPIIFLIAKIGSIYLTAAGFLYLFLDVAAAEGILPVLYGSLGVFTAAAAVLMLAIKHRWLKAVIFAAAAAAGMIIFRRVLIAGAVDSINEIILRINEYFQSFIGSLNFDGDTKYTDGAWCCFALALMIAVYLLAFGLKKCYPFSIIFPVLLVSAAELIIGKVPPLQALLMMFIGILGMMALGDYVPGEVAIRLKGSLIVWALAAAAVTAVMAAAPSVKMIGNIPKEEIRTAVRDRYEDISDFFSSSSWNPLSEHMGISEGRIDQAGNLEYSGENVMTVRTNYRPQSLMYLKGYGAGRFEGNRWEEIDDNDFEQYCANYMTDAQTLGLFLWNQASEMPYRSSMESQVTLEPARSIRNHFYMPYGSRLGENYTMSPEGYVDGRSGESQSFICNMMFYELTDDPSAYKNTAVYTNIENAAAEDYGQFVQEHYLDISEMSDRFIRDFSIGIDGFDETETAQWIREILRQQAVYTLEPGDMPRGENIIDYFLYENQQGYCMHFASAAVMMFRLNGIPARYAEGYVVSPGSFERDQDGSFVSVVHDYQAHAWPEIYIENVGWVPFEVTPAYENNEIAVPDQLEGETSESESESSTAQSESESETESQSESETVSAQTQSDPAGGTGHGSGSFKIPSWIKSLISAVCVLLCIAAAAAGWLYSGIQRQRKLRRSVYSLYNTQKLMKYMYRWLALAGVRAPYADGGQTIALTAEKIKTVDIQMLIFLMDKLLKSAYSKEGLTQEEYKKLMAAYNRLTASIWQSLGARKKLEAILIWRLPGAYRKGKICLKIL